MTIAVSALHANRLVDQVQQNLVGLQRDLVNNAKAHAAMTAAQSPDLATLQGFWTDVIASYEKRLGWVTAMQADPVQFAHAQAALARSGLTLADVASILNPLSSAVTAMAAANVSSYAAISAACKAILAGVSPPLSLWPE